MQVLWRVVGCLFAVGALGACGDGGDDPQPPRDGGTDGGGPRGLCPFRPVIDECQVLAGQPVPGQCEAGEACYWLIPAPCETNADCREGTTCGAYPPAGPGVEVCLEDLDRDGELEPAAQSFCEVVRRSGLAGDACERFDDCADGLTCSGGVCANYCCDDRDCDPVEQFCLPNVEQRREALGGVIGVCAPCRGCTLLPNAGCGEGEGCYLFGACALCAAAGAGAEGQECAAVDACAPGLACVRAADDEPFRCRRLCDAAAPCPPEQRCATGVVPSQPELGTCVVRR